MAESIVRVDFGLLRNIYCDSGVDFGTGYHTLPRLAPSEGLFNQLLQGRTFREHRVCQNKGTKPTIAFRACLCFAAIFARSRPPVLSPDSSGRFRRENSQGILEFFSPKSHSPSMLIGPHPCFQRMIHVRFRSLIADSANASGAAHSGLHLSNLLAARVQIGQW